MSRSRSTWGKGQSGSPKGKMPQARPLATALSIAGEKPGEDGKIPKDVVSGLIWQFMTTGQVVFESAGEGQPIRSLRARTIQEWIDGLKFVYKHLDGDPPKQIDVTTPNLDLAGMAYEQLDDNEKANLRAALKQAAQEAFDPEEISDGTVELGTDE